VKSAVAAEAFRRAGRAVLVAWACTAAAPAIGIANQRRETPAPGPSRLDCRGNRHDLQPVELDGGAMTA
jgi:hypothetical protein